MLTELMVATFPGPVIEVPKGFNNSVRVTVGHRDGCGKIVGREVVATLRAGDSFYLVGCTGRVTTIEELEDRPARNNDLV